VIPGWPPLHLSPTPAGDIERGDGELVIGRIEALATVSKDGFAARAGDKLVLRDWQRELLRHLFARRPDGRRTYRVALIGLPRKNGKSALGSLLALDGLLFDGVGAEVFSAAAEKEQARIVFGEAKRTVAASRDLSGYVTPLRDVLEVPATNSLYRVLSAEAYSKEGLNISRAIVDELHAHQSGDLWETMTLASGARRDPLVIAITTAGVMTDIRGEDSVCFRLWKHAVDVASGATQDDSFLVAWWGAAEGADHRDPEVWQAANPGYGDLIDPEDFASNIARTPEATFRTRRLNQWVASRTAFLPAGAWDALADKARQVDQETPVVLGFDGSRSGDTTALVGVTTDDTPHVFVLGVWERPPGAPIDWQVPRGEVLDAIRDACATYDVREVAVDMYLWQTEMADLEAEGLPIVAISQQAAVMVPATQRFYEMVTGARLTHDGDTRLARHLDNAVLRRSRAGGQLAKETAHSPNKIDAAVAVVMAVSRVAKQEVGHYFGTLDAIINADEDDGTEPEPTYVDGFRVRSQRECTTLLYAPELGIGIGP
jgi:phage terminase large subunit-like protein